MAEPHTNGDIQQLLAAYEKVVRMLHRTGLPADTRWHSLLMYFREMKDYSHLTDGQKGDIHNLLLTTLQDKNFSEEDLHTVLEKYKAIVIEPYRKKLDDLVQEVSDIIQSFRNLTESRYGNISELEKAAVTLVEEEPDEEKLLLKLRGAFDGVKSILESDMRSLEGLAFRDALTGIGNRRAFDAFMEEAAQEWRTTHTPFSLALFDIDLFKAFNDQHGHRVGDQVLQLVGKFLELSVPPLLKAGNKAIAARYGGEEFVLAVYGPDAVRLHEIAESLRQTVYSFSFTVRDTEGSLTHDNLHISMSAGVCHCQDEWRSNCQENMIEAADKAMYYAKGHGRNMVITYPPSEDQHSAA